MKQQDFVDPAMIDVNKKTEAGQAQVTIDVPTDVVTIRLTDRNSKAIIQATLTYQELMVLRLAITKAYNEYLGNDRRIKGD